MRLMTGKRAETLLELMYQIEYFTLARAWEGLTDEEFFWEPFTTTWSIRRQDQCRTPNPFGVGEWVADFAVPEPTPVPLTTIAWLYWHIGRFACSSLATFGEPQSYCWPIRQVCLA